MKGCHLQGKVCALSTGKLVSLSLPRESVLRLTDHLNMTIAVDWDVKPQTKQAKIRDCNTVYLYFGSFHKFI